MTRNRWGTVLKIGAYGLLLVLVLASLALNATVIAALLEMRQTAVEALDQAAGTLQDMEEATFETTVHIEQTIPVDVKIPFQREWSVPVRMSVPIQHELNFQETIEVPIRTPLFNLDIDVPVSATIPVSLTVPVETIVPFAIDETFTVATEVDIDLLVPVVVELADTPLPARIDELQSMLKGIRQQLEEPVRPRWEMLATLWQ